MASSNNSSGVTQSLISIFSGESYEFWSIRMRTILKSQNLWDLVENGFANPDEGDRLRNNKQKDAKKEVQGDSKVILVRLQSLRRDFETLMMKNRESIADFFSKVVAIVSKMPSYGEKVTNQTIVEKILRSLTLKSDHVVVAIVESKDLSVFSFDELMGSLQAHEARLNRSVEKNEEKAFQRAEAGEEEDFTVVEVMVMEEAEEEMMGTSSPMSKKINFTAGENEEENYLFACVDTDHKPSDLWFVDSGCSNHMTGVKSMFQELDEKQRKKV
ncbi:uncharacterized protein LOC124899655 [Capsicum annuum]|uniref:uncharacterized protein LOC124899655 n=1 Tax=Capsicum annuum TaxID=4072 RepID=UPI001FB1186A|nr:uncharacterized protein LOC124899655 [Capsicum annuum]